MRDMEIITYVREGAITHKDSLGNTGPDCGGRCAGNECRQRHPPCGIQCRGEPTTLFQIWIEPRAKGGAPSWGSKPFPKGDRSGRLVTLASGIAGDEGGLPIRADARVLGATLKAGQSVEYRAGETRHLYLVPATGAVEIDGVRVGTRAGAAITGEAALTITALEDAEIVLVDAP